MPGLTTDKRAAIREYLDLQPDERRVLRELARHLADDAVGDADGQRNLDFLVELFRRRPEVRRVLRKEVFWAEARDLILRAGALAAAIVSVITAWKVWRPW